MPYNEPSYQARARKLDELADEGHVDIEVYMQVQGLDWDDLLAAGIVQPKPVQGPTDLLAYGVTEAGSEYLISYPEHDLLAVRHGQGAGLLALCHSAARR